MAPGKVLGAMLGLMLGLLIGGPWAIVLFLITLSFSYFIQLKTIRAMVGMTNQPPPPDAPPGPPPGFVEQSERAARGGAFMTLLLFTILFLMVFKPF